MNVWMDGGWLLRECEWESVLSFEREKESIVCECECWCCVVGGGGGVVGLGGVWVVE